MLHSAVLFLLVGMVAVSCGDDPPRVRGFVTVAGNSGDEPLMNVDEVRDLAQRYLDAP